MPITKTYLNKKVVSSLKRMAAARAINPDQTKSKLVDAILKHEAKQKKLSKRDAPSMGIYATKKYITGQWIVVYRMNKTHSKTNFTLAKKQQYDRIMKAFKDRNMKKVLWSNVVLKK